MIARVLAALIGFSNLTLQQALEAAVAHSPDVTAANARVSEAAATLAAARGVLVPSLVGSYTQLPQGNPPGPNVISRLATIGLQTNVADFITYGPAVRESVLLLESSRDDAAVAYRSERVKTAGLYFDALKARAVVAARMQQLDLARAQRDAAQERFVAGDGPRLDDVRGEVAMAKATADLEAARGADANATDALGVETGLSTDDLAATSDAIAVSGPTEATDPDPSQSIARALDARAEIASGIAALHAEEAARRVASAGSGFPSISVGGGYTNGTDSGVPVGAPSINVALTLPLGSGARERVAIEDGRVVEAQSKVLGEKRSVALEVGASARDVVTLRRAAVASTRAREQAEIELKVTALGFRSGASSSLEVRDAQSSYAQTLVDERSALYDLAKARSTLELEMGR